MERIGAVIETNGDEHSYAIPFGATVLVRNYKSGQISFVMGGAGGPVEGEYQYNDGERWVKVSPKKSGGKFKNIPER